MKLASEQGGAGGWDGGGARGRAGRGGAWGKQHPRVAEPVGRHAGWPGLPHLPWNAG